MSEPRDRILARLRRKGKGRAGGIGRSGVALSNRCPKDLVGEFQRRAEAMHAQVYRVERSGWTHLLERLCREKAISNLLYGPDGPLGGEIREASRQQQGLPDLVGFVQEIEVCREQLFFEIEAAVTSVRAGVAATGTLILWPTPAEPRSMSLVPPIHFAVLDAGAIHSSFADVVEKKGWNRCMPTNALLISGPSKTADIEQTLTHGMHGPTELVILVLTQATI